MSSINMFKGDLEEHAFRKKARKRLIIISVSIFLLMIITIAALTGGLKWNGKSNKSPPSPSPTSTAESIKAVCEVTLYPDSCSSSISSLKSSTNFTSNNPEDLFLLSLQAAVNDALVKFSSSTDQMLVDSNFIKDPLSKNALCNCESIILDAIDYVNMSVVRFVETENQLSPSTSTINDIRTWLSAAITYQETCLDGLQEFSRGNLELTEEVKTAIRNSTEFTSNSLAIVTKILTKLKFPMNRKLLHSEADGVSSWFYQAGNRRILQDLAKNLPKANVTVTKDGSGDFKTIGQAVKSIPERSPYRFVIYIKEGVYTENATIGKRSWNVTMYGDGMKKTIISNDLNVVDRTPTFISGTLKGRGFIAMHMTFRNTAGPEKGQTVAMRSSSDHSIFYKCSFEAYQDTLYVHANRQFYRDCHITGTVDFIFGNAAVVFQNCMIQPREPLPKQFIAITAQSKSDPNQNTGICIQGCDLTTTFNNLTVTAHTYLGRPWKNYSTKVVMHSEIGQLLDPQGWTEWIRDITPPKTIFYGEYQNSGPGSLLNQRVEWDGYRRNLTDQQASKFTVEGLIQGSEWLVDHAKLYNYDLNV